MPKLVARENQAVRCIQLWLAMMRDPHGVHVHDFYVGRGWYWRSAYRDVRTLEAAGVPILARGDGWHRIRPSWRKRCVATIKAT